MSVNKYQKISDSNVAVGDGVSTVGIQEGMPRRDVNNAMRSMCADIAKYSDDNTYLTTVGSSDVLAITTASEYVGYAEKMTVWVKFHVAPNAAASININNLGEKPLLNGAEAAIAAGEVFSGAIHKLSYNGSGFVVVGASSAANDISDALARATNFGDRTAENAQSAASATEGSIVMLGGLTYSVKAAATGSASATDDLGVDGLVPFGEIYPSHVSSDLGTVAGDTAALQKMAAMQGDKVVDREMSVNAQITVSQAGDWRFTRVGQVTQTAANTALFKHVDGLGATWTNPKLRGYGVTDTASVVNNVIFGSSGQAMGLWFRHASNCNVVSPNIHGFKNAGIARQYCSDSWVTGILNVKGTGDDDPDLLSGATITSRQQFGIIDHAQSWVVEGGTSGWNHVGAVGHGNKNVGIMASGGTIEDSAIAYCCFPGFENVHAEGYATKSLTQHAAYVYAFKGAVVQNIRAGVGSSGVKFSCTAASGRNPTGCIASNITAVGGTANAVVFETLDKFPVDAADTTNPDLRGLSRFHFVSPIVSNIHCEDWGAVALIMMGCRDMVVNGLNVQGLADAGSGAPTAIEFTNCSGHVSGVVVNDVPRRAFQVRPHMFGSITFGGMNKITEPNSVGVLPAIEVQEANDQFEWYNRTDGLFMPEGFIFRTDDGKYYKVLSEGVTDGTKPVSTNSSIAIPHGTMTLRYMGLAAQNGKGGRVTMRSAFDIDLGLFSLSNHLLYIDATNDGVLIDWGDNVLRSKAGANLPPVTTNGCKLGDFDEVLEIDVAGQTVAANEQTFFDTTLSDALKVEDEIVAVWLDPAYDIVLPSAIVRNSGALRAVLWNFHSAAATLPAGYKMRVKVKRKNL